MTLSMHWPRRLALRCTLALLALLAASPALAQTTQPLDDTAWKTDQLQGGQEDFNKVHPDIEVRWAHDSTNAAVAISQLVEEGGQPEHRAPNVVTFHAPDHSAHNLQRFHQEAKARGFLLYPGKLTTVETLRGGCISASVTLEMPLAVHTVGEALHARGIPNQAA